MTTYKYLKSIYWFQDDNAPVHTAEDVKKWILMNKIKVLSVWPSQSPDLNPIEHLWLELERRIRSKPQAITNLGRIRDNITRRMGQDFTKSSNALIESMPWRIEAVIANSRWPTKF